MNNYIIYRNLKSELKKNKDRLSDLKKKSDEIKTEIDYLETKIEEDLNGLNIIFDYIISHKGKS